MIKGLLGYILEYPIFLPKVRSALSIGIKVNILTFGLNIRNALGMGWVSLQFLP